MRPLRLALRQIVRQPAMAGLAVTALALGIGLTTTMFSIINGAVLRGLPFPDSQDILHVAPFNVAEQDDADMRMYAFAALQARQQSFEQLAAVYLQTANVVGPDGVPERYQAARMTTNTLRLLRARPVRGRDFREDEGRPGAEPVVIIGEKVWRERFHASPDVVGQRLRVNGTVMTVIGVMDAAFGFPSTQEVWMPIALDPNTPVGQGPEMEVIGRLAPGSSREQASAEMATLFRQLQLEHPDWYPGFTTEVKSYIEEFIGTETRNALFTMLAAVFGVLLIACVNVANLVLARTADRAREIAVRTAIGASRAQVVWQLLVEVLTLAAIGAAGGLAIAQIGVTLFNRAIVDTRPPFWIDIRIDGTVLLFVAGTTVVAAVVAGLVPALRASRADVASVMKDEGRSTGVRSSRFSRGLVMVEMAVAFALLVVTGLAVQSIANLARVDFGYPMRDVFTARLVLPETEYADDAARWRFTEALLARMQALPGVVSASATTGMPLTARPYSIKFPGKQYATEHDYETARGLIVSSEVLTTLRAGVVEGRPFDSRDRADGQPVAMVNQAFAKKYFPKGAVGERFALARGQHQEWRTIVGVVPNLGMGEGPSASIREGILLPMAQVPAGGLVVMAHVSGPPLGLSAPVREAVRALDPNLPVFDIAVMWDGIQQNAWGFRVFGSLFAAFGVAALFLATVGLYGVMSYSVTRRTQEIGIRMAIGAGSSAVRRMVLWQGLWQVAVGILMGSGLAALLASALSRALFFNVSASDPRMFAGVALALAATGLLATAIPARRAASVDPMEALRYQ